MHAETAVYRSLTKNPNVEFPELDAIVEPKDTLLKDPKYASAWNLPKIGAPVAWNVLMMPIRVTYDALGYAYLSHVAAGLN